MQWFRLFRIEWLKTKRTFVLFMLFLCPLATALFPIAQHVHNDGAIIAVRGWQMYWNNAVILWSMLMMPMFCVLSSALLIHPEHTNSTWRVMFTLPVSKRQVYVIKLVMAWCFIAVGSALVMLFSALGVYLLIQRGYPAQGAFEYPVFRQFGLLCVSCIPMVAVQHIVSWQFRHLMAVLTVGLVATIGISFAVQSEYWIYYLWDYPTMALTAAASDLVLQAVILSVVTGGGLALVSAWYFGSRGIQD